MYGHDRHTVINAMRAQVGVSGWERGTLYDMADSPEMASSVDD